MKKTTFIIFMIFIIISRIFSGVGTTSIDILKVPAGIKSQGMGGAYVAGGNDIEALDYNPAGLKSIKGKEILFIHDIYLQDIFYDSIFYGQNMDELGVIGVGIKYLNSGSIIEKKENATGNYEGEGGSFSAFDYLLEVGYGMDFEKMVYNEFTKDLNIGATLKISGESLCNEYSNFGLSIDIGAIYDVIITEEDFLSNRGEFLWNKAGAGIVFKNLGTSFNGNITPISFVLGGYTQFLNCFTQGNKIKLNMDLDYNIAESLSIKGGIEYNHKISDFIFAIRTGGNFSLKERMATGINFGGGFGMKSGDINYELNYVMIPYGELGSNHKIGLYIIF